MNFLEPTLFELPPVGQFGNLGKNAFRGPGVWDVDMGFFKNFYPIKSNETFRVQFRGEFFNIFNHARFNDPNTSKSSAAFGSILGAADPRIIQLAMKVFF